MGREAAIKQIQSRNAGKRPGLSWHCMDARRMTTFPNNSFDIVLDRGTLDHFLAAAAEPAAYFEEVSRLLRPSGNSLIVSNGIAKKRVFGYAETWRPLSDRVALSYLSMVPLASMSRGPDAFSVHLLRRLAAEPVPSVAG